MIERSLSIVSRQDVAEREACAQRVDGYAVERRFVKTGKALPPTPPNAQRAEEILRPIRQRATLAEKMAAWKVFNPRLR